MIRGSPHGRPSSASTTDSRRPHSRPDEGRRSRRGGHRQVSRGQPCNPVPVPVPVRRRGHRCLIAIAHGPSSGAEWPPSWHRLGPLHTSFEAKRRRQRLSARAAHNVEWVCPRYPHCGQDAATFETGPRVSRDRCARRSPTIDAMPLEIHTQPDPDHFCETCGGPSELVSQTITPWDGNETMAREVSPWTPRCADPGCQSRRPRHRR